VLLLLLLPLSLLLLPCVCAHSPVMSATDPVAVVAVLQEVSWYNRCGNVMLLGQLLGQSM
jgi:hypothetical protein